MCDLESSKEESRDERYELEDDSFAAQFQAERAGQSTEGYAEEAEEVRESTRVKSEPFTPEIEHPYPQQTANDTGIDEDELDSSDWGAEMEEAGHMGSA